MRVKIEVSRPDQRTIAGAVAALEAGGVLAYPTDTVYGIGCDAAQPASVERVYRIRGHGADHPLSLLFADVGAVADYVLLSEPNREILARCLPGPFTFVLPARDEVPIKLRGERWTIGVRIPGCAVTLEIVRALGRPLVNTSAMVSADEVDSDPAVISSRLGAGIDLILDAGVRENLPSTVIDLCGERPELLRLGRGDPDRCGAGG